MSLHVRYKSVYISLPFSAKQQREMTKFCVFWKTRTTVPNFSYFHLDINIGVTYLTWASSETDRRTGQIETTAKFEGKM